MLMVPAEVNSFSVLSFEAEKERKLLYGIRQHLL